MHTPHPGRLLAASWNVHGFVGADGRFDPARAARLVRSWGADLVGLQESVLVPRGGLSRGALARALGLSVVVGPTLLARRAPFGNLLATHLPVLEVRRHDLSCSGREARGVLDVDLDAAGRKLRVVVTHLGLKTGERAVQLACLAHLLAPRDEDGLVLLADLNEWWPWRRSFRRFLAGFGGHVLATFPARRPVLALDRILVRPPECLVRTLAVTRRAASLASDHLPLLAAIDLSGLGRGNKNADTPGPGASAQRPAS
jgi:endonuclease/exonuclease/phosphatase family metal-dependent hydrolase